MSLVMVYITCKDKKEAKKISTALIEKRLVACTNIFPIESLYRWKGKIVNNKETVVLAKSTEKNCAEIAREVKRLHSYDVPCIENISTKANTDYEKWVIGVTR